ncbi:hypothetical protein V1520DRAFT_103557 [Lipomyces starkeyi]|uniref:Uncharacterized protein n=1 Tax=Lipomyces starkeyi NRRL Y-11557 TaxID=675824 RepID=A0A1E3PVY8_LIPST|nr:hypothetical protein LIPSTDRAFT_120584 [Lipomyces starkeyi NRRL Y-11557]
MVLTSLLPVIFTTVRHRTVEVRIEMIRSGPTRPYSLRQPGAFILLCDKMSIYHGAGSSSRSIARRIRPAISMVRGHSPPSAADEAAASPTKKPHKVNTKKDTSAMSAQSIQVVTMTSSSPALYLGDTEDQYQRALNFLVTNEPEQYLEVQLPLHKYEELERYADSLYGEKKYPYVDYDTNTSTAIIYTAPAPLHGMVSAQLQHLIQRGAEMALIQHNQPEIARKLKAYGESSARPLFGGYNSRISKVPDGGLIYFLTREEVVTVTIETGLSEKYE